MRPRSLEMEGLHSFKEQVHINFDELGHTGIFGIFGPTGSGKSTILDAITLALYGEVTRADYGTHGIINVGCQKSRVSFTFDILKGRSRDTYLVERVFSKRKGYENYASAKSARLIKVEDSEKEPMYDKPRDVTNGVVELLGLTHADFTRAVVLPQNKFQEFLLLDKLKKREMLERIFYLQEYGKVLVEKVTKKKMELESSCMQIKAKLDVLVEASDNAVKIKKKEYEDAKFSQKKTQEDLDKQDILYKDAKILWSLVCEKNTVEEKLKLHESKKEQFENLKQNILKANEAMKIKDVVLNFKKDENDLMSLRLSLKETIQRLDKLNDEKKKLQKNILDFEKDLEVKTPFLIERRTNLQAVLSYKMEVDKLEEKRGEKLKTFEDLSRQKEFLEKCMNDNYEKIHFFEQKHNEIIEKAKRLKVDEVYKNKVFEWIAKEDDVNRVKNKLESDKKACENYADKIGEIEIKQKNVMQTLDKLKNDEKAMLNEAENLEKQIDEDNAYILAKKLENGEKCPVCGSREHPEPFDRTFVESGNKGKVQNQLKNILQNVKEKLKLKQEIISKKSLESSKLEGEISTNKSNFVELEKNLKILEKEYIEQEKEYECFLRTYKINKVRDEYDKILKNEKALEDLRSNLQKEQNETKKIQDNLKKFQENKEKLFTQLTTVETEGKALREQIEGLREKVLTITDKADVKTELEEIQKEIDENLKRQKIMHKNLNDIQERIYKENDNKSTLYTKEQILTKSVLEQDEKIKEQLEEKGFENIENIEAYLIPIKEIESLGLKIKQYENEGVKLNTQLETLNKKIGDEKINNETWEEISKKNKVLIQQRDEAFANYEVKKNEYENLLKKNEQWKIEEGNFEAISKKKELVEQLQKVFRGNNFIDFIAEERLKYIAREASDTLGYLTRHRYALEINTENQFVVRDNFNGGSHRLVTSLSGGETFLTALALALALSKHIQLKGQSPLEFFFLDEGFGTLDANLLDIIMDSLERLSSKDRVIGLITHVPELKARISKRIIVTPPDDTEFVGSKVIIE